MFFLRFPYDLVTIDFMKFYDFLVGLFLDMICLWFRYAL